MSTYAPSTPVETQCEIMNKESLLKSRAWMSLPAVVLCAADHMVTLCGQPSIYWRSGFRLPRELAPHGRWLLQQHPLIFISFGLFWMALYATLILFLPRKAGMVVSLAIVIGHCWGIGTWLPVL